MQLLTTKPSSIYPPVILFIYLTIYLSVCLHYLVSNYEKLVWHWQVHLSKSHKHVHTSLRSSALVKQTQHLSFSKENVDVSDIFLVNWEPIAQSYYTLMYLYSTWMTFSSVSHAKRSSGVWASSCFKYKRESLTAEKKKVKISCRLKMNEW